MYIEKIHSPADLRKLEVSELKIVADEVRDAVLNRVSRHGGHVGPNLGFTEATVALHYVFDTPTDKLVFDVSHQTYPHKILTGRAHGFLDDADTRAISGYSSPIESPEYDYFEIGHTSTAISLATGLQKGRDVLGGTENIVAIVGDGSLSGGEAFEGLNTAAALGTNIIIVVNDNEMSIAENHGGLYANLRLLRETYGQAELNFFKTFGFDYYYLENGHNLASLVDIFRRVKDTPRPTVVHIHTEKGHGYAPAVEKQEAWHYRSPFDRETGKSTGPRDKSEYMPSLLGDFLREEMKRDPKLVVVASAVPMGLGFTADRRREAGAQYIDVGIAEEEAVALASGMAKRGARPVYFTYATFLQRTYDQIAQDLCVNSNPAVINVLGASIFGMNDFTHICFFDIAMLSHIPNLVYLAPTTYEELVAMQTWAIRQDKHSVAIRVPEGEVYHTSEPVDTDYSALNTFRVGHRGSRVALIAAGNFYQKGDRVRQLLAGQGIDATLINPRYLTGVDTALLDELKKDHAVVATLEDGTLDGGFGERIARHYGPSAMRVLNFGVKKQLYDRYDVDELLRENHLTDEQIAEDVLATLAAIG
ncbi:1-deoxy-D-xylulose-5-phosphate synthase [Tannerella serpentiformis]|uniref:1-deoxy-D-xylulose-5-phosphate synthase n=1 Tax=Tannerella serpentiformis TaxID=712710 RepID=UPI000840F18B|nr:1-deoxy-D-xylulose-5-phosphate synthase [Tannerella serpentiformis]AOH40639.1 1-deoxy-D-xylulose-5-phosphate synthase [Tannerella serpentiformis]AVV52299.1 1-deoxy-D-xylulose-5-phosphate synthase [Tannerella serpentiformis]